MLPSVVDPLGCDFGKANNKSLSRLDPDLMDLTLMFGADAGTDVLTKAERLQVGDSLMTHAMVFTGVDLAEPRPAAFPTPSTRPAPPSAGAKPPSEGGEQPEPRSPPDAQEEGPEGAVPCPPPAPDVVPAEFAVTVSRALSLRRQLIYGRS